MAIDLTKLTITSARKSLANKEFSAEELSSAYLEAIEKKDTEVHAYLEVFDTVLEQAKKADELLAQKKAGVSTLAGIPLAMKDNILIHGHIASAGSKMLANYFATYDAFVTSKLKSAGAIFLGRTNMDEFAMGSSTETSAWGPTKNPLDTSRVPGGSSGGSAATVAAGMALGALGSDTGGSIRQPAAFCGVVGLKPTYGAVSRSGLIAMASSFDQIGPFTKTVTDSELLFNVLKGYDPLDSTSLPEEKSEGTEKKKKKFTVGVPRKFFESGVEPAVLENFEASLKRLEDDGAEIRDISLPYAEYALAMYYIIMPAESSSNLSRFDGVRYGLSLSGENTPDAYRKTRGEGFGAEVRRRVMLGTYVLSAGYYDAYYNKAIQAQRRLVSDFENVWKDVDVIATPTTPTPAFTFGEKTDDPLAMYTQDIFTVPANIAGLPAISLPSGFVEKNGKKLPLGLQLIAPSLHESFLFTLGKQFLGENEA